MDVVFLVGMLGFGLMLIGWLGYSTLTNQEIRDQEREITRLIAENEQLRTALQGRVHVSIPNAPVNPECTVIENKEDPFKEW